MAVRIEPRLPKNLKESGNDCILAASRIVNERVAMGCTFRQPDIIPKVV